MDYLHQQIHKAIVKQERKLAFVIGFFIGALLMFVIGAILF